MLGAQGCGKKTAYKEEWTMIGTSQDESKSSQYLTFSLRNEDFAIDIAKVREVLDVTGLTRIPKMPAFISGVINLRGNVVPVMDLGYRLGMPPVEFAKNTCVMIVENEIAGSTVAMGTVADSVQMVVDLQADEIEAVPRMGADINTDFISGMGRQGDKFLILLNIDKVLSGEEKKALADIGLGAGPASEPEASTMDDASAIS